MPFQSRAQWKWAFANKKPFAEQWARETPVKLSQLPAYSKKAATTGNFSATAGERIGGNQCRDEQGHFVNCEEMQSGNPLDILDKNPGESMATWNEILEARRIISQQEKKKKKAEMLAALGLAPKKAGKISPEERKRQEREQQKKNEINSHGKVGPGGRLGAYLSALADPDNPKELPNLVAMQLQELGLVSPSRSGRFFITGEGRAYINAARSGDMAAAREAMLRARDSAAEQAEQAQAEAEQAQMQAEEEAFQQQIEAIEGTPRERRLMLAQKRREQAARDAAGKPAKPKPEPKNNTYGSGKVIAGSPKSTVKSIEPEEEEMPYRVPSTILKNMVIGHDFAEHHGMLHDGHEYARKAMRGEPFRIQDLRRMKSLHEQIGDDSGSRERPTIEWVARQLMGGAAGYNWMDSVVNAYEHEMSRYKSSDSDKMKPSMAASINAIRGLDLQHYFKRGGSASTIALGRKIANREEMDVDDIRAIKSYLEAHKGDHTGDWGNPADPSAAYVNWMIHGGDEGLEWANGRLRVIDGEPARKKGLGEDMIPSQSASSEAIRGLDLQFYFKRGGNAEVNALARKIANRKQLDVDDVRAMHAYFNRHDGDRNEGWANPADPSVAYINWMLHGGDSGQQWSNAQIERLKLKREKPESGKSETEKSTPETSVSVKAERKYMRASERAAIGAENFVFPEERKFEITDAASVTNAINSWPQYRGIRKYDEFRKKLTDLASKKGFAAYLPKAWVRDLGKDSSTLKAFRRAYAGVSQAEKLLKSEKSRVVAQALTRTALPVKRQAPPPPPAKTTKEIAPTVVEKVEAIDIAQAGEEFLQQAKEYLSSWEEMSADQQISSMDDVLSAVVVSAAQSAPVESFDAYKQSPFGWDIMEGAEYQEPSAAPKAKELLKVVEYKGKGKNTPSNPRLWRQAIAEAKKRYTVYPSAYANQFASKWYKKNGGKWSSEKDAAGVLL